MFFLNVKHEKLSCLRDGIGRHNGLKIRGALTLLPVQVRPQVPINKQKPSIKWLE